VPGQEELSRELSHDLSREELEAANAELRRRVELAEATIDELRAEALVRRAQVRALAEELPVVMSRSAMLRAMAADARRHPDIAAVVRRGVRKLGRAPRKAARMVLGPLKKLRNPRAGA
jgi:uncharacterized protein (DUF1501 family)